MWIWILWSVVAILVLITLYDVLQRRHAIRGSGRR